MNLSDKRKVTDKKITASYIWSEKECIDAHEWASKPNNIPGPGRLFKGLFSILFGGFVFMNLVVIFIESTKPESNLKDISFWQALLNAWGETSGLWIKIVVFFSLAFVLYWVLQRYGSPSLNRRHVKKHFAKHPDTETTVKLVFDDENVTCQIGDNTTTINKWKVFTRIVKSSGGFHFYIDNVYNWIPNHAFESNDDIESLCDLIQENTIYFEVVE